MRVLLWRRSLFEGKQVPCVNSELITQGTIYGVENISETRKKSRAMSEKLRSRVSKIQQEIDQNLFSPNMTLQRITRQIWGIW